MANRQTAIPPVDMYVRVGGYIHIYRMLGLVGLVGA